MCTGRRIELAPHYPPVQEMVQCKAHRSRPPDGVVTYGEGVGEEQRSNVPFIE